MPRSLYFHLPLPTTLPILFSRWSVHLSRTIWARIPELQDVQCHQGSSTHCRVVIFFSIDSIDPMLLPVGIHTQRSSSSQMKNDSPSTYKKPGISESAYELSPRVFFTLYVQRYGRQTTATSCSTPSQDRLFHQLNMTLLNWKHLR